MKQFLIKVGVVAVLLLGVSFMWQGSTVYAADAEKVMCQGVVNYTNQNCIKAYSCETLFTKKPNEARKCNWDRCIATRGGEDQPDGYCNCKYGANGEGDVGIPLNTNFPFIGSCLVKEGSGGDPTIAAASAFPTVISALSKMLVVVILAVGTIMIIIGGIQWSTGNATAGKEKIKKVAIGFLLLGAMGAILRFINPNFFK